MSKTNKELSIIQCCPDDTCFWSQCMVQLANFREMGISHLYRGLIFVPADRKHIGVNPKWKLIEEQFPEAKLFYYFDEDNILDKIRMVDYIPLLRPYCLERHFREYPELENNAIWYIDSDIILSKPFDFSQYLEDEICYLSDTKSYLNSDYFDGKIKDVRPDKLEEFKKIDVLDSLAKICGITREVCENNKNATGGAQYLLKNINANFWKKVFDRCMVIRSFLYYHRQGINFQYFESEDKGYQSWATDMIAVLFTLWEEGKITETPEEFNFNWATDPIQNWEKYFIYHDAGGSSFYRNDGKELVQLFNKRSHQYVNNLCTYFEDDLSFVHPDYCSKKYVEWIQFTKDKYIYK